MANTTYSTTSVQPAITCSENLGAADRAWAEKKAAILACPEVQAMIAAVVDGLSPAAEAALGRLETSFREYVEYALDTGDYGALSAEAPLDI